MNGFLIYQESVEAGTGNWAAGLYLVALAQKGVRFAAGKVLKK
jgi:hypothetical protein